MSTLRGGGCADHFDKIATGYDSSLPQHVVGHYVDKRVAFIRDLLPSGSILDVGCGTGTLSARLVQAGFRVLGADASLAMLRVYQAKQPGAQVLARADSLPFAAPSFDMVISVATLHHLAEPQTIRRAIREMFRLVRPGGFLVLWDHNPWNPYWKILMRRVPQDVGTERLIRRKEVISALDDLRAELSQRDVWHLGFVPDFVPRRLLRAAARLEAFLEKLPLVRLFSAHTVFVFRRRSLLPHVA